eukprot:1316789-Pleurochrysis_carterae.AAC.1
MLMISPTWASLTRLQTRTCKALSCASSLPAVTGTSRPTSWRCSYSGKPMASFFQRGERSGQRTAR